MNLYGPPNTKSGVVADDTDWLPVIAEWRGESESRPSLVRYALRTFMEMPIWLRTYIGAVVAVQILIALSGLPLAQSPLLFLTVYPLALFIQFYRDWRDRKRSEELLEPGIEIQQDLFRVALFYDKTKYGDDVGVLMLIDGMLVFQGTRTNFAVTPEFAHIGKPQTGFGPVEKLTLRFHVDNRTYEAEIELIRPPLLFGGKQAQENLNKNLKMLKAIQAWTQSRGAPFRHVVLPPTAPSPDSYRMTAPMRMMAVFVPVFVFLCEFQEVVKVFHGRNLVSEWLLAISAILCAVIGVAAVSKARKMERALDAMRANQEVS